MSGTVDSILIKAKSAEKRGNPAEAERLYRSVLAQFPGNLRAQKGLAGLVKPSPDPAGSGASVLAMELDRLYWLYAQGRLEEVVARGELVAASYPSADLYNLVGGACAGLEQFERAASNFQNAVLLRPEAADYTNLGTALKDAGRVKESLGYFAKALAIEPDFAAAHYNFAVALSIIGYYEEAIEHYRGALAGEPDNADAHSNSGIALQILGRIDESIDAYERALEINPGLANARANRLMQQMSICNWDTISSEAAFIADLGIEGDAIAPFVPLSMEDVPDKHRIRSARYAAKEYPSVRKSDFTRRPTKPERLRIGYFSADFHDHATMYLIARLFELHDVRRFEIHAYSTGSRDDDEMRSRLTNAVEVFHNIRELSDREAADLARRDGLDIAVDLKGYTGDSRLGIFACRAAPVQISYLGYPGTLAAPFIDYIVADKVVIPEEMRQHYAESVIYLPDSYQVNDNTRAIADRQLTRAEMGLPETGFVFCCFNSSYKITPEEFDIWMRLLDRVEGSVLWLFETNQWAPDNLRREAEQRGIDPDRLVFAERLPQAEHLARHGLADLFLDTFNVNAHTTASDSLWAGLPVVTKLGSGFPARVAGSLLTAIGLPELVTTTSEDYEALALDLATNPVKLSAIKAKLAANRLTAPLFDSEALTRHIEAAYETVYGNYLAGDEPRDIVISR